MGRYGRTHIHGLLLVTLAGIGCGTPASHLREADRAAYDIIADAQQAALGRTESFTVAAPADTLRRTLLSAAGLPHSGPASYGSADLPLPRDWPEINLPRAQDGTGPWQGDGPLSLLDALQVAARHSREYQDRKDALFRAALRLDLERAEFRTLFAGMLSGGFSQDEGADPSRSGAELGAEASASRKLETGVSFAARVALDLVKLLSGDGDAALGLLADVSVTVPLLRGAGRDVVAEPLTQAERDVLYAVWEFERFKRVFAVDVATEYLEVLRELDRVRNVEENYRGLVAATRRARRLADAGRLPEIQVDQVVQDALRARERWIQVRENHDRRLDDFKLTLGLPTDTPLRLDRTELEHLGEAYRDLMEDAAAFGTEETPPADAPVEPRPAPPPRTGDPQGEASRAVGLALENRLDLRAALGQVADAQRKVGVAADALRAGLDLVADARSGGERSLATAGLGDVGIGLDTGRYAATLGLDLPWERSAERAAFRESVLTLEQAVRAFQAAEDQVKYQVRDGLRRRLETREAIRIQAQAAALAERRVRSTDLFLQAGRAQIRDLLEAREALLATQNSLTEATIAYRVAELGLQRDLGTLRVDERGLWREFEPRPAAPGGAPGEETPDG